MKPIFNMQNLVIFYYIYKGLMNNAVGFYRHQIFTSLSLPPEAALMPFGLQSMA